MCDVATALPCAVDAATLAPMRAIKTINYLHNCEVWSWLTATRESINRHESSAVGMIISALTLDSVTPKIAAFMYANRLLRMIDTNDIITVVHDMMTAHYFNAHSGCAEAMQEIYLKNEKAWPEGHDEWHAKLHHTRGFKDLEQYCFEQVDLFNADMAAKDLAKNFSQAQL